MLLKTLSKAFTASLALFGLITLFGLKNVSAAVSTPTPTPTDTPTPTPISHHACNVDHMCVLVEGEGSDTCSANEDCLVSTPTPTPTPTPTASPCIVNTDTQSPTPCPTDTPAPTPTPLVCGGNQHPDASDQNCVSFSDPGPPPQGGSGGTTSTGQVLGASTLAATGDAESNIGIVLMLLGTAVTLSSIYALRKSSL
jgi:hypothetical protein